MATANPPFKALDEDTLEQLDALLEACDGPTLGELDGFLTALALGPQMPDATEWLPLVFPPDHVWDSPEQAEQACAMVERWIELIRQRAEIEPPDDSEQLFEYLPLMLWSDANLDALARLDAELADEDDTPLTGLGREPANESADDPESLQQSDEESADWSDEDQDEDDDATEDPEDDWDDELDEDADADDADPDLDDEDEDGDEDEGEDQPLGLDWATGFRIGMGLCADAWKDALEQDQQLTEALAPVLLLGAAEPLDDDPDADTRQRIGLVFSLPFVLVDMHRAWQQARSKLH